MKLHKSLFFGFLYLTAASLTAQNIYIYSEQALEFGDFTVAEAGGTVTISSNGERSSSGTTQLLNSTYHPAVFRISTDNPNPMQVLVEITREALSNSEGTSMVLTSVSSATDVYMLQAGKPTKIVIGGTIQMNSQNFSSGAFFGNISITVTRNE